MTGNLIMVLLVCLMIPGGFTDGRAETWMADSFKDSPASRLPESDFVFVRGKYTNYSGVGGDGYGYGGRRRQWWETDYDDAERNLLRGLRRYTTLAVSSRGYRAMSLTDPQLFEYPFLYINMKRVPLFSGNGPNFNVDEAAALREFMLRGGFVMVDDFWGAQHWQDFLIELAKIFPGRRPVKLALGHPLFHSFFDIDEIKQVPGRGVTWGFGAGFILDHADYPTAVHGVFDERGRLMMAVNFNTDLGDGWEHTFDQFYPTRYCNAAYKIGINTIVYALSH
jgi:hypothetical protein